MYLDKNQQGFLHLVRALSAQLVLIGHAISSFDILPFLQPPQFPYIQNIGVVAFFFLSGIVIASSVDSKHDMNFGRYFWDRFSRIYVAVIPALILVAFVDAYLLHENYPIKWNNDWVTFIGNVLMTQNYPSFFYFGYTIDFSILRVSSFGSLRPIWSVMVEYWMYIFYGFILLRGSKNYLINIFFLLLFIYSIPVIFDNFVAGYGAGLSFIWFFGALSYHFIIKNLNLDKLKCNLKLFFIPIMLILLSLLFGRWIMSENPNEYDLRYSFFVALAILFGVIYIPLISSRFLDWIWKYSTFFASYSFSLYLVHYSIIRVINIYFKDLNWETNNLSTLLFCIVISNVIAYLFYWLFEKRYLFIRKKGLSLINK